MLSILIVVQQVSRTFLSCNVNLWNLSQNIWLLYLVVKNVLTFTFVYVLKMRANSRVKGAGSLE